MQALLTHHNGEVRMVQPNEQPTSKIKKTCTKNSYKQHGQSINSKQAPMVDEIPNCEGVHVDRSKLAKNRQGLFLSMEQASILIHVENYTPRTIMTCPVGQGDEGDGFSVLEMHNTLHDQVSKVLEKIPGVRIISRLDTEDLTYLAYTSSAKAIVRTGVIAVGAGGAHHCNGGISASFQLTIETVSGTAVGGSIDLCATAHELAFAHGLHTATGEHFIEVHNLDRGLYDTPDNFTEVTDNKHDALVAILSQENGPLGCDQKVSGLRLLELGQAFKYAEMAREQREQAAKGTRMKYVPGLWKSLGCKFRQHNRHSGKPSMMGGDMVWAVPEVLETLQDKLPLWTQSRSPTVQFAFAAKRNNSGCQFMIRQKAQNYIQNHGALMAFGITRTGKHVAVLFRRGDTETRLVWTFVPVHGGHGELRECVAHSTDWPPKVTDMWVQHAVGYPGTAPLPKKRNKKRLKKWQPPDSAKCYFHDLPDDLIWYVFSLTLSKVPILNPILNKAEQYQTARVCRRWRQVTLRSSFTQYGAISKMLAKGGPLQGCWESGWQLGLNIKKTRHVHGKLGPSW